MLSVRFLQRFDVPIDIVLLVVGNDTTSMQHLSRCSKQMALLLKEPLAVLMCTLHQEAKQAKTRLFVRALEVFGRTPTFRILKQPRFAADYHAAMLIYRAPYMDWHSQRTRNLLKTGELRVQVIFLPAPGQYKLMLTTTRDVANDLRIMVHPRDSNTGLVMMWSHRENGLTLGYRDGRFVDALAKMGFEHGSAWYFTATTES